NLESLPSLHDKVLAAVLEAEQYMVMPEHAGTEPIHVWRNGNRCFDSILWYLDEDYQKIKWLGMNEEELMDYFGSYNAVRLTEIRSIAKFPVTNLCIMMGLVVPQLCDDNKGSSIGWHSDDNTSYLKECDYAGGCCLNSYGVDFYGGLFRLQDGQATTSLPMEAKLHFHIKFFWSCNHRPNDGPEKLDGLYDVRTIYNYTEPTIAGNIGLVAALVALSGCATKETLPSFGADQFDEDDLKDAKEMSGKIS
ncbi:hypothetical protein Tco_1021919, partial [Tanacetum coccineum]